MTETTIPDPTSNPKDHRFAGPCPRCDGPVPNAEHQGVYPGALSRYDNETYICSDCGTVEAMFNFLHRDVPLPETTVRLSL